MAEERSEVGEGEVVQEIVLDTDGKGMGGRTPQQVFDDYDPRQAGEVRYINRKGTLVVLNPLLAHLVAKWFGELGVGGTDLVAGIIQRLRVAGYLIVDTPRSSELERLFNILKRRAKYISELRELTEPENRRKLVYASEEGHRGRNLGAIGECFIRTVFRLYQPRAGHS